MSADADPDEREKADFAASDKLKREVDAYLAAERRREAIEAIAHIMLDRERRARQLTARWRWESPN